MNYCIYETHQYATLNITGVDGTWHQLYLLLFLMIGIVRSSNLRRHVSANRSTSSLKGNLSE